MPDYREACDEVEEEKYIEPVLRLLERHGVLELVDGWVTHDSGTPVLVFRVPGTRRCVVWWNYEHYDLVEELDRLAGGGGH